MVCRHLRDALARELAAIYDRPTEIYETMLDRTLSNRDRYFAVGDGRYGLTSWLLDTSLDNEEDVLFDATLRRRMFRNTNRMRVS